MKNYLNVLSKSNKQNSYKIRYKCHTSATPKQTALSRSCTVPSLLNNIFWCWNRFLFYLQASWRRRFSRQIRTSNTLLPGTEWTFTDRESTESPQPTSRYRHSVSRRLLEVECHWITFDNQYCGSASCWCGSGFELSPWCVSGFLFLFDADPDLFFHPDADSQILAPNKRSNPWISAKIGSYSIRFCLSSANWCGCGSGSGSSLSLRCGYGFIFVFDADLG